MATANRLKYNRGLSVACIRSAVDSTDAAINVHHRMMLLALRQ